jgi:methylenetetrahydrofolate dehydrogenase (NADP+)/methenyltetrahydrofolate cyclohydrolase/formyltetrahydrofolate synthetase
MKILGDVSNGIIWKIIWASYGSHIDSWYFAYKLANGTSTFRFGSAIPAVLRQFIDKVSLMPDLCSALRVQLGDNNSFVAWAKTTWACHGIPEALEAELCRMSLAHTRSNTVTRGSFEGTLSQVMWHSDGSYYVKGQVEDFWNFESSTTLQAWNQLWRGRPDPKELAELAVSTQNHLVSQH